MMLPGSRAMWAVLLAIAVLGVGEVRAAEFTVAGMVADAQTGRPIPRAAIRLRPAGEDRAGRYGFTGGRQGGPPGFPQGDIDGDIPWLLFQAFQALGGGGAGPRGGRQQDEITVIADARGYFQATLPNAGRWTLAASARGYRQQRYQQHGSFSTALVLSAATSSVQVHMRLEPDGRISGYVRDEAGDPVSTASVILYERVPAAAGVLRPIARRATTIVDDRGFYEFEQLAPGEYLVAVSATPWYAAAVQQSGARAARATQGNGQSPSAGTSTPAPDPRFDVAYPLLYSGNTTDVNQATPVRIVGGDHAESSFQMTPVPSLHVELAMGAGNARAQQIPMLQRLGPDGLPIPGSQPILASAGGGMELTGLTQGEYRESTGQSGRGGRRSEPNLIHLTLRLAGLERAPEVTLTSEETHVAYVARASAPARRPPEQPAQPLNPDDPTTAAPATRPEPTANHVAENPLHPADAANITTDLQSDASMLAVDLPPGHYRLSIQSRRDDPVALERIDGTKAVNEVITVDAPNTLTVFIDQEQAQLQGVAIAGGRPIAGALVELVPARLGAADNLIGVRRAQSGTDGSFVLENLAPGAYILFALQRWQDLPEDLISLEPLLSGGVAVELKAGQTASPKVPAQP
jgi:hypothetical protein